MLDLELSTGLAGTYLLQLDFWGFSSTVFILANHFSAVNLRQLPDLNADGNSSSCKWGCEARNVSNLARLHPQHIRVAVEDGDGNPVFQAQVRCLFGYAI